MTRSRIKLGEEGTLGKGLIGLTVILFLLVSTLIVAINFQQGNMKYNVASGLTLSVPGTYGTIQLAINAANDGDTITVAAGTYNENVIVNKSISLIGQGRDQTIIDGQDIGTTVRISSSNVVITGFEITHGRNESILIEPQASNCEIYGNSLTYSYERGIMASGPNTLIYDNIAHDCGMVIGHGVIESIGPTAHGNSVFNNLVYSSNTWGIGCTNTSSIRVFNNTSHFLSNRRFCRLGIV